MGYSLQDIKRIANEMRKARDDGVGFALLAGAGMSYSANIPLADGIVKLIHKKYKDIIQHRLSEDELNDYAACMECLSLNEREKVLRPLLDDAKLNWGNLALATLMEAGYISRVLTFNFDNVLARACGVVGLYPAIYDFAAAPSERTDFIASPSIVHLHGQGTGMVMMNSENETKSHAKKLRPILKNTLDSRQLIVLGYSGESDRVFEELNELYEGRERLFWCGYGAEPKPHIRKLLEKAPYITEYIGEADADKFMIDIARELTCFPPLLFVNHFGHLLNEIKPIVDFPDEGDGQDILSNLRETLEKGSGAEPEKPNLLQLLLAGKWDEIVEMGIPVDEDDKNLYAWALLSQGNALEALATQNSDEKLYREAIDKYKAALAIKPDDHEALSNWGSALQALATQNSDVALYRQAFGKYKAALAIKPDTHEALYNWGGALQALATQNSDEELYRQAFNKYEAALAIKPDYHEALYNWGGALQALATQNSDEELYRQAIDKYKAALAIKPDKLEALSNWGSALQALATLNGDVALYRQAFGKYKAALEIKPDYHEALYNWGGALAALATQNSDEKLYRQAFDKYEAAWAIKPDKHEALHNWGGALINLWRLTKEERHLVECRKILNKARKINPDNVYNFACLEAVAGNFDACREYLETCLKAETLPAKTHLQEDADLEPVREFGWFKEIVRQIDN